MILKILGLLDIFVAITFWIFGIFGLIPAGFVLILGLFLLAKGIGFVMTLSVASFLDIFCAIIIVAGSAFALPKIVVIIVSLFLLQKGIFSLVS